MQYIWKYLLLTFDEVIIVCGGRGRYNSTWKYCHGVVVSIHMSNIVLSNNKLHLICILWIWLLVCISQYLHLSLLVDVSPRVQFSDRTGLTAGLRYRFTGPVRPVTGRNRTNANLNSNFAVVAVVTGIPAGYTGLPDGFAGIPAGCASRFLAVYRPEIPVYRPVLPVYRLFRAVFRRLKNGFPVWNKRKFRH